MLARLRHHRPRPAGAGSSPLARRGVALLAAVALVASCQPGRGSRASPDTQDRPFFVAGPPSAPPLVFPPPLTAVPRGPSPSALRGVHDPYDDVDAPYLDDDGAFSFTGRTLSVSFVDRVRVPEDARDSIHIDPPVAGTTTWNNPWSVSFVAEDHFDPEKTYTLTLGAITSERGNPVAKGYEATFTAKPTIAIAGKVIHYFPDTGNPKLVTVRPWDGAQVGPAAVVTALFDQPVDRRALRSTIEVHVDGAPVPVTLNHPREGIYEGVAVDPAYVLEIRPTTRPAPGSTVDVTVTTSGSDEQHITTHVAHALALGGVDCGSGGDPTCTLKAGTLHLPGRSFTIRLNNAIKTRGKRLTRAVKIAPKVRNLSVWSDPWEETGRVHISGEFAHSKTYRVQIGALTDRFGGRLHKTVAFDLVRPPRPASVSMAEGVLFADAKTSRAFEVSTRNTERAKLALWEIAPTGAAHREAQRRLSSGEPFARTPDAVITIQPKARRDVIVTTRVDLLDHIEPGKSYLATLELSAVAFGAPKTAYPSWARASRPPTALITPHDENAIVLHAHTSGSETMVYVARLATGEPVADAQVLVDGALATAARTDAQGLAIVAAPERSTTTTSVLTAEHKGVTARLAVDRSSLTARHFAPELAGGRRALGDVRALLVTDRGAYRPGATVRIKAALRQRHEGRLRPLADEKIRIRVLDPSGGDVHSAEGRTDALGGVSTDFAVGKRAPVGRYRILVEPASGTAQYATQTIDVAEFETPRFSVDVELSQEAGTRVVGTVVGKYLFGASMDGATASWTLRRADAPIPAGSLSRRGLRFRRYRGWYEEDADTTWTRTGSGTLSSSGTLRLRQAVQMPKDRGPQRFTLEAEVADDSHRTIAGRGAVVLHPAAHYPGIKVTDHWLDVGKPVSYEVGVIDQTGNAVSGKTIRVELARHRWVRTRKSGPGGSYRTDWHVEYDPAGSCTVRSASTVSSCALTPGKPGDYRIATFVDGEPGGSDYVWVWGGAWSSPAPSKGRSLEISLDKASYAPGDTVKLVVANPFARATALVTLEEHGMVHRRAQPVTGRATTLELTVPRTSDGPWMHATVTLLPRGGKGVATADWKIGAVRIPLKMEDVALSVTAVSDRDAYEPGAHVALDLDVTHAGKPAANVDVVLAVVDEGVLRLTNHHAPDPVAAMHPGQPLDLVIDDNRRAFAELLTRSHTAGDGPGSGAQSLVGARKNFVRTALWAPSLKTDAQGHIDVEFDLPDNLTRFRVTAVALDARGRAGSVESGFVVRKPLMAQPAVPRFATLGDSFEAAVLVHNNTQSEERVTVGLDGRVHATTIAAGARKRVSFSVTAKAAGVRTLVFSVRDAEGAERDRVIAKLPVQAPGLSERPRLSGAFVGSQDVRLEIPSHASAGRLGDDFITVTLGEELWPELAGRLEYLVDYPHGCVEQTTSSTVPLLAAREIFPRMGVTRWSDDDIKKMIRVGVERLDSMRTSSGGLAYWPGGHEPNLYGTAYAMNAVVGAKRAGVALPSGLLEGMRDYLAASLLSGVMPWGNGPEVRAAVALSLSDADALPAAAADALVDTQDKQGPFGLAALAIALSTLDHEEARVSSLLDALEATLDDKGDFVSEQADDLHYFGSVTRSKALAAIALGRLRPNSEKLPPLVHHLLEAPEGYTTQSTAYALLALSEHIGRRDGWTAQGRVRALVDGVDVRALLGTATALGPGAMQYTIPLARLKGHRVQLKLQAETDSAVAFSIAGHWRRAVDPSHEDAATTGKHAPDLWRVVTDVQGRPVDLDNIAPGTTLRVVLLARLPHGRVAQRRMGYLALTDRLPAGFEALQPALWTVASVPTLWEDHPAYGLLGWGGEASHAEFRDDRAVFYYDRIWGDYAHATYLMRATTPGHFLAAPASAELMYETDGTGYTEGLRYRVTR